jgi:hypothetical protein
LIFVLSLSALNCGELGGTETGNPTNPTNNPSDEGTSDGNDSGDDVESAPVSSFETSWSELHISESDCMSDQDVIITSDGSFSFSSIPEEPIVIEQWSAELSVADLQELDDLITAADLTQQEDLNNASACDSGPSVTLLMTDGTSYDFHVSEAADLAVEAPGMAALLEKIDSLIETYTPTDGSQFIPVES